MLVTNILSTKLTFIHKWGKGARRSGGKKHDRSGASEEMYVALCTGYEGGEGNGTRHSQVTM